MIDKIEPAELNAVTLNLYKGEDVYNFIESLGIERKKALKVLDFIKDYAEEVKESKSEDELYFESRINELEEELDDAYNSYQDLQDENDDLEFENMDLQDQIDRLNERIAELEAGQK